jgi:hypothetical protein
MLITSVHEEIARNGDQVWVAGMQCQGCLQYILASVRYGPYRGYFGYETHYPLGNPDERVAKEIPDEIKPDFKEALRCRWVDAYNATAEMCRRALEASCLQLGAPKKDVLEDMIDWLEEQRIITPHLQKVAHKIRLGGNRGAHPEPKKSPTAAVVVSATKQAGNPSIMEIEKEHADAIITFTKEFFHHVYTVPAELDKYDFSKPKEKKP